MLTKSLKISDTSKKVLKGLISLENYQKISQKHCRADLSSGSDSLTCWLCISILIWGFLGFEVTPLFSIYNFSQKSPVRLKFLLKVFKILWRFRKCRKNLTKVFFCVQITAFELVALNPRFYWENMLVIWSHYANRESQDFR